MAEAHRAGVGREDSGLTNKELEQFGLLTGIPMAQDYPSLNLGQAVMVYCYQLLVLHYALGSGRAG